MSDCFISRQVRARDLVATAKVTGKLTAKPCEICGSSKVHAHHSDYRKPYDVTWLCVPHHKKWHRLFEAEDK